jgi:hypothetical protein
MVFYLDRFKTENVEDMAATLIHEMTHLRSSTTDGIGGRQSVYPNIHGRDYDLRPLIEATGTEQIDLGHAATLENIIMILAYCHEESSKAEKLVTDFLEGNSGSYRRGNLGS